MIIIFILKMENTDYGSSTVRTDGQMELIIFLSLCLQCSFVSLVLRFHFSPLERLEVIGTTSQIRPITLITQALQTAPKNETKKEQEILFSLAISLNIHCHTNEKPSVEVPRTATVSVKVPECSAATRHSYTRLQQRNHSASY